MILSKFYSGYGNLISNCTFSCGKKIPIQYVSRDSHATGGANRNLLQEHSNLDS